jgi:hypothetical protein
MTRILITDDQEANWIWDTDECWLDISYPEEEERLEGSGYMAASGQDVVEILVAGGFVEEPDTVRKQLGMMTSRELWSIENDPTLSEDQKNACYPGAHELYLAEMRSRDHQMFDVDPYCPGCGKLECVCEPAQDETLYEHPSQTPYYRTEDSAWDAAREAYQRNQPDTGDPSDWDEDGDFPF